MKIRVFFNKFENSIEEQDKFVILNPNGNPLAFPKILRSIVRTSDLSERTLSSTIMWSEMLSRLEFVLENVELFTGRDIIVQRGGTVGDYSHRSLLQVAEKYSTDVVFECFPPDRVMYSIEPFQGQRIITFRTNKSKSENSNEE